MQSLDLKTLCIPYVQVLALDDPYATVRRRFLESRLRALPVVDEMSRRYYGVVYRRNLLFVSASRTSATARDLIESAIEVNTYTPLRRVIELLVAGEGYAVLADSNRRFECLLGIEGLLEELLNTSDKLLEQPVEKVMARNVPCVGRREPIERVWKKLLTTKVIALAVVENDGRIVGVVSEHDLLTRGYARPRFESDNRVGKGPSVETIMSTPPFTVKPGDPLRIVVKWMVSRGIGRVYVVDEDDRLLGVVDRLSIAKAWLTLHR